MGHWEKSKLQWHEVSVTYCELCGQIIPSDMWVADVNGENKDFCTPECEEIYLYYWLPKYGED